MEQKYQQLRVAILGIVLLSVIVFAVTRMYGDDATPNTAVEESKVLADKSKLPPPVLAEPGLIQMSLVPRAIDSLPVSYTYRVGSRAPDELAFSVKKESGFFPSHLSRSPNGLWSSFLGIIPPAKGGTDSVLVLYRAPYVKDTPLAGVLTEGQMIMNFTEQDKILAPRLPQVNDKGRVLYMALHDKAQLSSVGEYDLINWDIHYNDGKLNSVIATGLYPHWISNEEFIYLSKDGMHRMNALTKKDSLLSDLSIDGNKVSIAANMMIAVSKDGRRVAFANPEASATYVYELSEAGIAPLKTLDGAGGFWPLFSPDGKTLAIQVTDNSKDIAPRASVQFWDIERGEMKPENLDLSAYRPGALFMTDWK